MWYDNFLFVFIAGVYKSTIDRNGIYMFFIHHKQIRKHDDGDVMVMWCGGHLENMEPSIVHIVSITKERESTSNFPLLRLLLLLWVPFSIVAYFPLYGTNKT